MKNITNKDITKKIIVAIVFVILFSFTVPNYSFASVGGVLFKPFAQFICGVGDLVFVGLQKTFLGNGIISDSNENIQERNYYYYYTPYNIFSGNIPGLDINFIEPEQKNLTMEIKKYEAEVTLTDALSNTGGGTEKDIQQYAGGVFYAFTTKNSSIKKFKKEYNYTDEGNITKEYADEMYNKLPNPSSITTSVYQDIEVVWLDDISGNVYVAVDAIEETDYTDETGETATTNKAWVILYEFPNTDSLKDAFESAGEKQLKTETYKITKASTGKTLQKVMSKWYKTLRTIALVGLMSVLVYIGIRILISSTGEDKAKYKTMLKDWVIALALIFILQYIMALVIEATKLLTQIISGASNGGALKSDQLLNTIRKTINQDVSFGETIAEMLMYLVILVYTVTFTFTYLKRVVFIGFFTLISPLVALTYPLDKISDGNAQAFNMWLREYIFNCLLQVIHILLYVILVDSAQDLVTTTPLYGVVAIGAIVPAEKILRKMFGFEKAETIGKGTAAAAAGAATMNAINKLKSKATSKDSLPKEKEQEKLPEAKAGEEVGKKTGGAVGKGTGALIGSVVPGGGTEVGAEIGQKIGEMGGGAFGKTLGTVAGKARKKIVAKGKKAIRGAKIVAKKKFTKKKVAKYLGKKALQGALGATMGTIGLAAGIATGDLSKAAKFGAGGLMAGSAMGKGVVNGLDNMADSIAKTAETYMQGYLGTDYNNYKNAKLDKAFMNDSDMQRHYMTHFDNYKVAMNDALIARQNGITDNDEITKILNSAYGLNPNATEQERIDNVKKMVNISQLDKQISDESFMKSKNREEFRKRIADKIGEEQSKKIMELLRNYKGLDF